MEKNKSNKKNKKVNQFIIYKLNFKNESQAILITKFFEDLWLNDKDINQIHEIYRNKNRVTLKLGNENGKR